MAIILSWNNRCIQLLIKVKAIKQKRTYELILSKCIINFYDHLSLNLNHFYPKFFRNYNKTKYELHKHQQNIS